MDSLLSCLLLTSVLLLALGTEEQREIPTIAVSQIAGSQIGIDGSLASGDSGSAESQASGLYSGSSFSESESDTFSASGSGSGSRSSDVGGTSGRSSGTASGDLANTSGSSAQSSGSGLPDSGSGSTELADISGNSGQSASGLPDSGSGSAELADVSGSSGSGSGSGRPDSGSGSAELANVSSSSSNGSGSGRPESDGSPGQPDNVTMLTTTLLPYTTIVPNVLVSIEELSELQRENIVTIVFRGLKEETFIESGIEPFRRGVARIVNAYLPNKGNYRQKRQQTPLTPEDVLIIEPLVEDQDGLHVALVVGGVGGQSTPISKSELSNILEANGQQLASELSTVSNLSVQFAGVVPIESPIRTTSPTTTRLSPKGTVIIQSNDDNRSKEQQILPAGAIVGVVIGVLFAAVLAIALLLMIISVASYRALSRRQQYKMGSQALSNKHVGVPVEGGSEFVDKRQPLAEENNYHAVPVSDEMQESDLATKEL